MTATTSRPAETIRAELTQLRVGDKGTTGGFPATIVRICEWSRNEATGGVMVEVRVPGGIACIPSRDFVREQTDG